METAETSPSVTHADIAAYWNVYRQKLFRIAYNVLHHAAAAEDACQQAILKACESRQRIHGVDSLGPWLTRTIINESLIVLRRRKVEVRVLTNKAQEQDLETEHENENAERRKIIMEAIGRLPEPARTVVVLRIINGMPGNQVKDMVGCSSAEVSRRLHTGMEILRRELKEWWPALGES